MNDPIQSLPWLLQPLRDALNGARGHHALLVHGPRGVGQFELAFALAKAWLCEAHAPSQASDGACGRCASCRLIEARSHPDLAVLLPELLRERLGWVDPDDEATDGDKKRKPSKDIRIEAVRRAVAFAQTSSARGRAKVVVVFPADRMNAVAANALLKTLEEPPGLARFVLATGDAGLLLPTVRSRCRPLHLPVPPVGQAVSWLEGQGIEHAGVLLAAAGGQPLEAKAWREDGIQAGDWSQLPAWVAKGRVGTLPGWPVPRAVEALQKLCHDVLARTAGASPRYFADVPTGDPSMLHTWADALRRAARHAEHPVNAALLVESLVLQGRQALQAAGSGGGVGYTRSHE